MAKAKKKPVVLITLTGGGHLFQSRLLIRSLGDAVDLAYITTTFGYHPRMGSIPEGPAFIVPQISSVTRGSMWHDVRTVAQAVLVCLFAIIRIRPTAVIGVGTGLSIPLLIAGRLLNRQAIFVESITRVSTPSKTARLCSRLHLASRIYVQWPELANHLRKAVYQGTVL